jgi:hypothetical protein
MKRAYLFGAIAAVALAVVVVVVVLVARSPDDEDGGSAQGHTAQAQALEERLGADSCVDSGLALEDATGSRLAIYDCAFGARRRCVTVQNGIASDATADVKRVFASAPGGARLACVAAP